MDSIIDQNRCVNNANFGGLNVNISADGVDHVIDPNDALNVNISADAVNHVIDPNDAPNINTSTDGVDSNTDINNQNTTAHVVSNSNECNILNPSKILNNVIPGKTVNFQFDDNGIQNNYNSKVVHEANYTAPIYNDKDTIDPTNNVVRKSLPESIESMINTNYRQEMNESPDFNQRYPPPPPLSACDELYQLSSNSNLDINQNLGCNIINKGHMNNKVITPPNCSEPLNISIKNNNSDNNTINVNYPLNNHSNNSYQDNIKDRHNNDNYSNNNNTYSNNNNNHPSNSFEGNIKYRCNDNGRDKCNNNYRFNVYQRNGHRLYNNQRKKPNLMRVISNYPRRNRKSFIFYAIEHKPGPTKVCYLQRSDGSVQRLGESGGTPPNPKKPWYCPVFRCPNKWHKAPVVHAMKRHVPYEDLIYCCIEVCGRRFKEARSLKRHKCDIMLRRQRYCRKCETYYQRTHTNCKPLIL